jgi:hypothetical protein
MFNCKQCEADEELKVANGCMSPAKDVVWETDRCFFCYGESTECLYCQGTDRIKVYRCPRSMYPSISCLLPYYYDYKANNRAVWPDGRARMGQPVKLQKAFDILDLLFYEYEKEATQNVK